MSIEQTKALYASVTEAVAAVNAVRQQAANGSPVKTYTEAHLKAHFGGSLVKKKFFEGGVEVLRLAVLRTELEKLLDQERTSRYNQKGGYTKVSRPVKGNGKKPSDRPTGG